ncbi:MAG: MFS transporter [Chloroflexota bacterium]|nr:MFS transporter [Chloroflexota bacterium]
MGIRYLLRQIQGFSRNARLYLLATFIRGIQFGIFRLIFNLYIVSLGYRQDFLGLLRALDPLVMLLTSLPAGVLSDRIGRKRALLLSSTGRILSLLGFVFAPSATGLVASSVALGGAKTLLHVSRLPFMIENSDEQNRTALFSADFSLLMLAGFSGNLLGGWLPGWLGACVGVTIESAASYRLTVVALAVLIALSTVPYLFLQPRREAHAVDRRPSPREALHEGPLLVKLLLPTLLVSLGGGLLTPFLNLYMKQTFALPDTVLGFLFAVADLCASLAVLVVPLLSKRWGKVKTTAITQIATTPLLLALGFIPALPVAIPALWGQAGLIWAGDPLYSAFTMEQVKPQQRSTVSSLRNMVWTFGRVVGQSLSGLVQVGWGFGPLFTASTALYLASALLLTTFFGQKENLA